MLEAKSAKALRGQQRISTLQRVILGNGAIREGKAQRVNACWAFLWGEVRFEPLLN